MNIEKLTLTGPRVRLEPLSERHLPGLHHAISDGRLWELPVTFVPHPNDLAAFLADAEAAFDAGRELSHAFENWGGNRVELLTDEHNAKSG